MGCEWPATPSSPCYTLPAPANLLMLVDGVASTPQSSAFFLLLSSSISLHLLRPSSDVPTTWSYSQAGCSYHPPSSPFFSPSPVSISCILGSRDPLPTSCPFRNATSHLRHHGFSAATWTAECWHLVDFDLPPRLSSISPRSSAHHDMCAHGCSFGHATYCTSSGDIWSRKVHRSSSFWLYSGKSKTK